MATEQARRDRADQLTREGTPNQKLDFLKDMRTVLDRGEIDVADFIDISKPFAEQFNSELFALAGSGSAGADAARDLVRRLESETGFVQNASDPRGLDINLPEEFQQRLREELLPENISAEERERLLETIPTDIGFDTDRFKLEREGIRQRLQEEKSAETAATGRSESLEELTSLLAEQGDQAFDVNRAGILEDLNARGLFRSSAVGTEFARERGRQADISRNIVSAQSISDRDANINALIQAGATQRDFQTSGLSREFSLDDFGRQTQAGFRLGEATSPQLGGGKSGGQKALDVTEGAANLANIFRR